MAAALTRIATLVGLLAGLAILAMPAHAQTPALIGEQIQAAVVSQPATPAAGSKVADVTIVFADVSEWAARPALAANWQGKFIAAHNALMG